MTKIDESVVKKVANLARLHLTDEEVQKMGPQLEAILASFANIEKVPTQGIEPLVNPNESERAWRVDEVQPGLTAEQALAAAPTRSGNSFKVPPVV